MTAARTCGISALGLGALDDDDPDAARCRTSARPAASRRCAPGCPSRPCRSGCSAGARLLHHHPGMVGEDAAPAADPRRIDRDDRLGRLGGRRQELGARPVGVEPVGATSSRMAHQSAWAPSGRRNRPTNEDAGRRGGRRVKEQRARTWDPSKARPRPAAVHEALPSPGRGEVPPLRLAPATIGSDRGASASDVPPSRLASDCSPSGAPRPSPPRSLALPRCSGRTGARQRHRVAESAAARPLLVATTRRRRRSAPQALVQRRARAGPVFAEARLRRRTARSRAR